MQPPAGLDRVTERACHGRGAIRSAEHVEESIAAIGERNLDAIDVALPARVPDGASNLVRGGRSLELVGCRQDSHRAHLK